TTLSFMPMTVRTKAVPNSGSWKCAGKTAGRKWIRTSYKNRLLFFTENNNHTTQPFCSFFVLCADQSIQIMTTGRIKNFIGLIGMFLLLFACSNDDEGKDMGDHASIFIDSDIYHEAESDDFHLEEARITGDFLEVRIRYGGGCGEV